jgi:hypothetical protein
MNLNMQGAGGFPQNLLAGDPSIVTGPMGDCVSVIVLYHYNAGNNQYANGRGWHGFGGAQVVNMATMMAGVPNVALTQVIIIPGSLQQTNFAMGQTMAHVQAGLGAHGAVNVRYVAGRSNATVSRRALIT